MNSEKYIALSTKSTQKYLVAQIWATKSVLGAQTVLSTHFWALKYIWAPKIDGSFMNGLVFQWFGCSFEGIVAFLQKTIYLRCKGSYFCALTLLVMVSIKCSQTVNLWPQCFGHIVYSYEFCTAAHFCPNPTIVEYFPLKDFPGTFVVLGRKWWKFPRNWCNFSRKLCNFPRNFGSRRQEVVQFSPELLQF